MSTIINGRGIVTKQDVYKVDKKTSDEYDECNEKFVPMTTEEYRKLKLTAEQEWNENYCPKRCSIEALHNIEVKNRGNGPTKEVYINSKLCIKPGPYYDPCGIHTCIWKSHNNINNLIGPQNQNIDFVQLTNFIPGTYCCICHKRNLLPQFTYENRPKSNKSNNKSNNKPNNKRDREPSRNELQSIPHFDLDEISKNLDDICTNNFNLDDIRKNLLQINISKKMKPNTELVYSRWGKILSKVIHTFTCDKLVYPISKFSSLLLWPWQLTPYQKFRLNNMNYTDSCIFIKSDNLNFYENYATIT